MLKVLWLLTLQQRQSKQGCYIKDNRVRELESIKQRRKRGKSIPVQEDSVVKPSDMHGDDEVGSLHLGRFGGIRKERERK